MQQEPVDAGLKVQALTTSTSLREQALAVLRQGLVTGDLEPGQLYSAASVASRLDVSTSPIREALVTLVSEGLLEPVRNRGYRVVPLSDKDRQEIYDLRIILEPHSMAVLAASGPELIEHRPLLQHLAELTVTSAEESDIVGHLDADRRFHLGLMELVGNERMSEIVMRLRDQTRRYSIRSMPQSDMVSQSREHIALLDAIFEGETESAREIMVGHLQHLVTQVTVPTTP